MSKDNPFEKLFIVGQGHNVEYDENGQLVRQKNEPEAEIKEDKKTFLEGIKGSYTDLKVSVSNNLERIKSEADLKKSYSAGRKSIRPISFSI